MKKGIRKVLTKDEMRNHAIKNCGGYLPVVVYDNGDVEVFKNGKWMNERMNPPEECIMELVKRIEFLEKALLEERAKAIITFDSSIRQDMYDNLRSADDESKIEMLEYALNELKAEGKFPDSVGSYLVDCGEGDLNE